MWLRRLVTIVPSLVVIFLGLDPTRTLVISQVVLSFGLPFAVVPLVLFTRRRDLMGELVNWRLTTWLAWLVAALIVSLNLYLIYQIPVGRISHDQTHSGSPGRIAIWPRRPCRRRRCWRGR